MSVGIESEGTLTGVGVFHVVTGLTSGSFFRGDFPVTVSLDEAANAGHHSPHVLDAVLRLCFVGGESASVGKSVVVGIIIRFLVAMLTLKFERFDSIA